MKVVVLIKLVYFRRTDCLSLELNDYKKSVAKLFLTRLSEGQLYPPPQNDNGAASKFKAQTGGLRL